MQCKCLLLTQSGHRSQRRRLCHFSRAARSQSARLRHCIRRDPSYGGRNATARVHHTLGRHSGSVAARGAGAAAGNAGDWFLEYWFATHVFEFMASFNEGLEAEGFVHGRNILIDYRWVEGHYDELSTQAAELVRRKVALIAATGGVASAQAAIKTTTTIPIVFVMGVDPVQLGLVASLNNPGGNATGVLLNTTEIVIKRLDVGPNWFRQCEPSLFSLTRHPFRPLSK